MKDFFIPRVRWQMVFALLLAALLVTLPGPAEAEGIGLVIDGKRIEASPSPVIIEGRTLVPVRLVSEELGLTVHWDPVLRSVSITHGNRTMRLWNDNRLVERGTEPSLTDVPIRLMNNRTFVPLRLVATGLGVYIHWDEKSRTVFVDSSLPAAGAPEPNPVAILVTPGQVISGPTPLRVEFPSGPPAAAEEVRFFLLDPKTGCGPVVARGKDLYAPYSLIPDPLYDGGRLLAAAVYDSSGGFLAGTVTPLVIRSSPRVRLEGLETGQKITGTTSLSADLNFIATHLVYQITNSSTGKSVEITADPWAAHEWTPSFEDNGDVSIRPTAYDRLGNSYFGPAVTLKVAVERQLSIRGISSGATVSGPVRLSLSANFRFEKVEYLLEDPATGTTKSLAELTGSASYRWIPAPEDSGRRRLTARVTDPDGNIHRAGPVEFRVEIGRRLILDSVGPNQVLTGEVKLRSLANVPLKRIEYHLIDPETGSRRVIAGGNDGGAEYSYSPQFQDSGSRQIQSVAFDANGRKLTSEPIPVVIYLGKIYGPAPIIEKSRFQDFASALAVKSQAQTGMSAALQVAQAILETGWGQYSPVDKYSGQPSYNLFGIKGKGPAGSVTSNTWEEYNGQAYRVDADFRAYNNPEESWKDHKELLLKASRYEPFREVMYDSTRGAWALRRCGYATDSQYPLKLIDLIRRYDLHRLDEVGV